MKCPVIRKNKITHGNSLDLLKCMDDESVDLIVTSPPYSNARKGHYNSVPPDGYKDWFMEFATEMKRVLKPGGSFILNIKEQTVDGQKHPYVFETVLSMQKDGWKWIDTYLWNKTNPLPVTPHRKFKDGFEHLFHFTKEMDFKWRPKRVRKDVNNCKTYNASAKSKKNYVGKHGIYYRNNFIKSNCKKAYPTNVLTVPVGGGKTLHPAQYPEKIPEFFIKALTDPGDVVLDPFAGSGTTAFAAIKNCRDAIGFDLEKRFVDMANERLENISCDMDNVIE